jgi:hypothetical protein
MSEPSFPKDEEWREMLPRYPSYFVSNQGRFRHNDRLLKYSPVPAGYVRVEMRINNKSYRRYAHCLVAEYFIPKIPGKPLVDHINRKRNDNRVGNLRWADKFDNAKNRNRHPDHRRFTVKVDQLTLEGQVIKTWPRLKEAAFSINVKPSKMSRACRNGKPLNGFIWKKQLEAGSDEWCKGVVNGCKIEVSSEGKIRNSRGQIIRGKLNAEGYRIVTINYIDYPVHRLVCLFFKPIGNYEKMVVDHIDMNKENNNVDNLEWVTPKQNAIRSAAKRKRAVNNKRKIEQLDDNGLVIATFESRKVAKKVIKDDKWRFADVASKTW